MARYKSNNQFLEVLAVVAAGIAATLLALTIFIIAPVMGVFFGMVGGWVVGLFLGHVVAQGAHALGLTGITADNLWAVGGALGFLGAYMRSTASAKVSKD